MKATIAILLIVIACLCLKIHSLKYELSEAELSRDICHDTLVRIGDVRMDNYEVDYQYLVGKP